MNRNQLHRNALAAIGTLTAVVGFATLVATPAYAFGEATYELPQPVVSTQSRADVRAATLSARVAGMPFVSEANWPALPAQASVLSRAEVSAQARIARADGTIDVHTAEPHAFSVDAPGRSFVAGMQRTVR